MLELRIFLFRFFLVMEVGSALGFTIKEGPLFNNSQLANVTVPYANDGKLYGYRLGEDFFEILVFNAQSLSLEKQQIFKGSELGFGKELKGFYQRAKGSEVTLLAKVLYPGSEEPQYLITKFELDKVREAKDFIFREIKDEDAETEDQYPTYEDAMGWLAVSGESGSIHFFGIVLGIEEKVVHIERESLTGKILRTDVMELKKGTLMRSKEFYKGLLSADLRLENAIPQSDGSVVLLGTWSTRGANRYSDEREYNSYYQFDACVFRMGKGDGWYSIIPIKQTAIIYQGSQNYLLYMKYGIAEDEENLYFFYNDDKDMQTEETIPDSPKDYLIATEADDGVLSAITMSKATGKWHRETIHTSYKTGSFFHCNDGIQINDKEFVMVVDIPKKNGTRLVKITL